MAAPYKLTYFNMAGRAEPIRLAFAYGGIAYEDERINFPDWPARKPTTPLGSMPYLTFGDGSTLTQSFAILHFAGKLAGLVPESPLELARADEVLGVIEDVIVPFASVSREPVEIKKAKRESFAAEGAPRFLAYLERRLHDNGGQFYVGQSLTIADLASYNAVTNFRSGFFDFVSPSLLDPFPLLRAHADHVRAHPRLAAHFAAHSK
eukprot:m.224384 g.224384  ORF g.224384 m.224384 type:complete len:207 (+) comp16457_c0_seq1:3687-4307(+)